MLQNTNPERAADYGHLRIARRVSLAGPGSPGPAFSLDSTATPANASLECAQFAGVVFHTAENF